MANTDDVYSLISASGDEQALVRNSDNAEHNFNELENELLTDIRSLHLKAQRQPSHSIIEELENILSFIFVDTETKYLEVKEDFTPAAVDILLSEIKNIIDCISPTKYGEHKYVDFVGYFNLMEAYIRAMALEIEDSISMQRTGLNHEARLNEIIQSFYSIYDNVVKAGVILGNTHHELWSPLLKKRSLQDILPQSEEEEACPVCLDVNITEDENFVMFSSCRHLFCHSCIARWLQNNSSCPMCRQPVTHRACRDEFLAFKADQRALQALHGAAGEDGASTS
ncbi:uncharacterized protein LOC125178809 [Hyalella azteca]|uniref:Uncharacterized protein LOC125178809 n=1 Tax=Hyalella azteca TaxID=294128 RepID=A0A979FTM8_HYAAZ|nr:uncharacterized protein LOC125178809 [Hyalella azteca]